MTTLLTGATGFIGRFVLDRLRESGEPVVAVSSKPHADEQGVRWLQADALDAAAMIAVVGEVRPTTVMHLAWECGRYGDPIHLRWLSASLDWFAALPEAGCEHVLTAGSSMEYCWGVGACAEDVTPMVPATLYGEAKLALGRLVGGMCRGAGMTHTHPRIFFVCGPTQPESKLLSGAVSAVLEQRQFVCKSGEAWRDYLEVADVARVLVDLQAKRINGPVNVGSGRLVKLGDLVEEIGRQLGRLDLIEFGQAAAASDDDRVEADINRLRQALGDVPGFDPCAAIGRIIDDIQQRRRSGEGT